MRHDRFSAVAYDQGFLSARGAWRVQVTLKQFDTS